MYADLKTRLNESGYSADDEASESADEKKQKMEVTRRKRPFYEITSSTDDSSSVANGGSCKDGDDCASSDSSGRSNAPSPPSSPVPFAHTSRSFARYSQTGMPSQKRRKTTVGEQSMFLCKIGDKMADYGWQSSPRKWRPKLAGTHSPNHSPHPTPLNTSTSDVDHPILPFPFMVTPIGNDRFELSYVSLDPSLSFRSNLSISLIFHQNRMNESFDYPLFKSPSPSKSVSLPPYVYIYPLHFSITSLTMNPYS